METYSIENEFIKAVFIAYGAILHQLWVKDKNGNPTNVIMGLAEPEDYLNDEWARGAVIGRFAGRLVNPIKVGQQTVQIENNKGLMLHSGSSGWHLKTWMPKPHENKQKITFEYHCPDGTSGFPGSIDARVTYSIHESVLLIQYQGIPSKTTPINMTNHAYFNLNPNNNIGNHKLTIDADDFLELQSNLVPTGKKIEVTGTPLDFRKEKFISETRLDDYFVVNQNQTSVASLYSPETGIEMKTYTDQPGVVVFTPPHFEAICFETQKFSNSPNIPSFPSTLIEANEEYSHRSRFEFSLKIEA
ncbi:galactose mutarotase [Flavobacteriaceae bacterium]|nr:galactose mutarotase [Flavobacteriaceae bacterium]